MRLVAILAARNEERFIAGCLEHLFRQQAEVYLVDNDSTDATVAVARDYLGRGLIGIERVPHDGVFRWAAILDRKEQIAATFDADWVMHVDADEIHLPPPWAATLAQGLAAVEAQGYNAVNFLEFTFVPTREAPDHDHASFLRTMQWYYPYVPALPHLVRAWKKQPGPVGLAWSGGHQLRFPGLRLYPESFPMRHYPFLSVPHALAKYTGRRYDPAEIAMGWHRWRARFTAEKVQLPSRRELREWVSNQELDARDPRTSHYFAGG